jgi:CRP-like cAMP-binding protein
MTESTFLSALAEFPFSRELSAQQREVLAAAAQPFVLDAGAELARAGGLDVSFNLITQGLVALSVDWGDAGPLVVQRVGPGEIVGWSWLVPPHSWQFDAMADEEVHGYRFEGAWLRDLCERDHGVGHVLWEYVASVLASRLAATRRTSAGAVW